MNISIARQLPRLADQAENIPHLRRLIVGLAISGKLAARERGESSSDLVSRLAAEREKLVKAGKVKAGKVLAPVTDDECPLGISMQCAFDRLGNVALLEKGRTGIQGALPGPFPLVVTAAERSCCDHFDFDGAAAIVPMVSSAGHGKASINRLHYQEGKFALGNILCAIFPLADEILSARFIYEYLSTFKDELLVSRMSGTANVSLTITKIAEVPVPMIASSIQRKVDELMALCDQLEAAQTEREKRRDKLITASLCRLTKTEDTPPSEAREHARFYLNLLPRLTTRPGHIPEIRKTILELAVRGRLVPQHVDDEPVTEMLKRIAAEKAGLVGSRNRSGAAEPSSTKVAAGPHSIPSSWLWVPLGEITIVRDGERIPVPKHERARRNKIYDYYGASGVIDKIDAYLFDKPLLLIGEDGANLVNRSTPIAFMARGKYWVNNHAHVLDGISEDFLRYIELHINATDLIPYVTGTAQPKMNQAKMNSIPIALPPEAEQRRIVGKVDEVMLICDRLETELAEMRMGNARLLESVLHHALATAA